LPDKQRLEDIQPLMKADIITILRGLGLDSNDYWVVMGAALVMHGVREATSDIDLAVSDVLFGQLLESGYSPLISRSGRAKVVLETNVAAYKDWTPVSWTVKLDIRIASLDSIIEEKLVLARQKDLRDMALLMLLWVTFPSLWVAVHDRPGSGGQRPPRVRSAMAISESGLW